MCMRRAWENKEHMDCSNPKCMNEAGAEGKIMFGYEEKCNQVASLNVIKFAESQDGRCWKGPLGII